MNSNEKATAATVASPKSALSWQAAHPFFKATRRSAQIHAAHLARLQRAAPLALANVADPARETFAGIVEEAAARCPRARGRLDD